MTRIARWVVEVAVLTALIGANAGVARADDEPSPWHLALDAGYGRARVGYLGLANVAPADAPIEQPPQDANLETLRLSAALGLAGLALEGSATISLGQQAYVAWAAGVRLETSWQAALSVAFRIAFVERTGTAPGRGGRIGIGLSLRPVLPVALYADAFAEATTPPAALRDAGTWLAYALVWTGGVRFAFR